MAPGPSDIMRVLALDPATTLGFSYSTLFGEKHHGEIDVSARLAARSPHGVDEPAAMRLHRMYNASVMLIKKVQPDFIVIEDSHGFMRGQNAVKISHELRGVIKAAIGAAGPPWPQVVLVDPGKIKIFGTGKAHAEKEDMIAAAQRRWGYRGHSDNEADAIIILAWALEQGEAGLYQEMEKAKQKRKRKKT